MGERPGTPVPVLWGCADLGMGGPEECELVRCGGRWCFCGGFGSLLTVTTADARAPARLGGGEGAQLVNLRLF